MVEFDEGQLKRVAFHLLTFKNPKARLYLLKNRVSTDDFFCLGARQLELIGLLPAEIKVVRGRGWSAAENEVARLEKNHVQIIFREEKDFPPLLGQIYDPPDFIYFTGNREVLVKKKLAVVGSRRGSAYGQSALNRILPDCCRAGLVVVSGMAYGIDSMAHRLAVRENSGTIGVNAGGLLHLYPQGNMILIKKIIDQGGIISEFPLDVIPRPFLFPIRNRIIAGIAQAVLIVEAALRSGSLITARLALEQNRDVMAVPGNIDSSLSQGTNYLLQQGAKLIQNSADLLDEFGLNRPLRPQIKVSLSFKEKKILDLCGENELKDIDFLVEALNWSAAEIISLLMGLVLKNLLVEEAGGYRRMTYG
ncbi:MAG: DNA-processing protein DprA [Candidatus Aminicenantes bacterium]|nr:DNA-processing protein DprA [Candidatus Aminicenantes bacterium]